MAKRGVWRFLALAFLAIGFLRSRKTRLGAPSNSSTANPSSYWIAVPGGSCRLLRHSPADATGKEKKILFLHCLGGQSDHWIPLFRTLTESVSGASKFDLAAIELPGHGESDPISGEHSIDFVKSLLTAALNSCHWRQASLVVHGSSTGFAAAFAAGRPDRVSQLFFLDPPVDQTRLSLEGMRRALEQDPRAELLWHYRQLLSGAPSDIRRTIERDVRLTDPNSLAELALSWLDVELTSLSKAYHGPKTALCSSREESAASLDGSIRSLRVPGGHWLMLEDPRTVANILRTS